MSDLGERVARAYGWELVARSTETGKRLWAHDRTHSYTPDPENSWADFGALLEWAAVKIGRAEVYAILFGDSEEAWADTVYEGDPWPLSRFRRAVTESILEDTDAE